MADDTKTAPPVEDKGAEHSAPKGAATVHSLKLGGKTLDYSSQADWLLLRKNEKPLAEMFFISYTLITEEERPVTFVFNGGPGASSVYLHLGAVGPKRVDFKPQGQPLPPPYGLVDNRESWLQFTDLVFIDPVGTGFSRMIDKESQDKDKKEEKKPSSEYWQVKRDLESLSEFIRKYLSKNNRWESAVYLAGESYGGFRTAKLAKMLQQDYGVGLKGAIIISPALEFTLLDGSDYDVLMWLDSFPTMAAGAYVHGKARNVLHGEDLLSFVKRAGAFGVKELLPALAAGDMFGEDRKNRVLGRAADFMGLPRSVVRKKNGRVDITYFVKNLLREKGLHLGLYDASLTVTDPYPDRDEWVGPDPTLHHVERVFGAGINTQLRKHIGLDTDRDYNLLSEDVNTNWKVDTRSHALETQVGATDDLRYGMSLNPDMKVFLTHGYFDLVTPFFSAQRITNLMKLTDEQKEMLTVKYYKGGHMFYTWEESRKAFFEDIKRMFQD